MMLMLMLMMMMGKGAGRLDWGGGERGLGKVHEEDETVREEGGRNLEELGGGPPRAPRLSHPG